MDLNQVKLSKSEWESIEVPVSENEKQILDVIVKGYNDIHYRYNRHQSIFSLMKSDAEDAECIHAYFFNEYFVKEIQKISELLLPPTPQLVSKKEKGDKKKKAVDFTPNAFTLEAIDSINAWTKNVTQKTASTKLKKNNMIRIQNMASIISSNKFSIVEFTFIDICSEIYSRLMKEDKRYSFFIYTLMQVIKSTISNLNPYVISFIDMTIAFVMKYINIVDVLLHSHEFIEKNKYLLSYEDVTLYPHQKQIFSLFGGTGNKRNISPKLVLYTAPTGTGKTLTPIGLSNQYRVIFVCVARHVGLALAKSAVSIGKKVAFAFGCETASDIRLHYFSAVAYTINYKSGGIHKVDNSVGTNVEIMICDVQSYLTAMHYMLSFNSEHNIITYWDEPTITMDYDTHPLHEVIHKNWVENKIPNVIFSCATLPKQEDILDTIRDFEIKFEGAAIHSISSYDCKKSISLLNKNGMCCLPHLLYDNYSELMISVEFCKENMSLLRYFDLQEVVRFIDCMNKNGFIPERLSPDKYFESITNITMNNVKTYYLELLGKLTSTQWTFIHTELKLTLRPKFDAKPMEPSSSLRKIQSMDSSIAITANASQPFSRMNSVSSVGGVPGTNPHKGLLLTTSDAYTLTDGPTIYLADDVMKIGMFCLQQSNIPHVVLDDIINKIKQNEQVNKMIDTLEKQMQDTHGDMLDKKINKGTNDSVNRLLGSIEDLKQKITSAKLDMKYIPNTKQHQQIWAPNGEVVENAFMPQVDETNVKKIMALSVESNMKMLLLLGIGMFVNNPDPKYMEIMKTLATNQQLYLIIAQSDYIYGTNYQFCHGFLGKDMTNMTQQKIIQSIGRIGRNNVQNDYTVRFRDDGLIKKLMNPMTENLEAVNMSRLFCSM